MPTIGGVLAPRRFDPSMPAGARLRPQDFRKIRETTGGGRDAGFTERWDLTEEAAASGNYRRVARSDPTQQMDRAQTYDWVYDPAGTGRGKAQAKAPAATALTQPSAAAPEGGYAHVSNEFDYQQMAAGFNRPRSPRRRADSLASRDLLGSY